MDEQTWQTSQDVTEMLRHVSARASARQLRLFACGCVRLVWNHLRDDSCIRAFFVAERFADGLATQDELRQAELACFGVTHGHDLLAVMREPSVAVTRAVLGTTQRFPWMAAEEALIMSAFSAAPWTIDEQSPSEYRVHLHPAIGSHSLLQANLLREILGNPFRSEQFHPDWLAWNNGVVVQLASAIYAEQHWQELPVLGDALEEAGCDNEEILTHCRGPGPHVRGCWVVDQARGVFDPAEPRP